MRCKYLINFILALLSITLTSCSNIDTTKIDYDIQQIEKNYEVITLDSRVTKKKLAINSNEKIKALYFFNPKCPGCWIQYEEMCEIMDEYSEIIDLYVFIYNVDVEFMRYMKFKNFKIEKEIYVIDEKPIEFKDETLYYSSKNKKQFYSVLNQRMTKKEISYMVNKLN